MQEKGKVHIKASELEFGSKIAEGKYGTVYKGKCRGQTVAIKLLHNQHLSEEKLEELKTEVEIMTCAPISLNAHQYRSRSLNRFWWWGALPQTAEASVHFVVDGGVHRSQQRRSGHGVCRGQRTRPHPSRRQGAPIPDSAATYRQGHCQGYPSSFRHARLLVVPMFSCIISAGVPGLTSFLYPVRHELASLP